MYHVGFLNFLFEYTYRITETTLKDAEEDEEV